MQIALEHYGERPAARLKDDGTWVSMADEAVERALRERIADAFPLHNVLGEEEGFGAAGGGPAIDGAPTWVLDPIDGTDNFLARIPVWATLVGLQIDGSSVVGAACAPLLDETYAAATGSGARMNGVGIAAEPIASLEEATIVTGGAGHFAAAGLEELRSRLVGRAARDRGFGDFWGHLLVARGAAHVMVDAAPLSFWDIAPLAPIVTEAGARLTAPDGTPWVGGPALTTCGSLHERVVGLI